VARKFNVFDPKSYFLASGDAKGALSCFVDMLKCSSSDKSCNCGLSSSLEGGDLKGVGFLMYEEGVSRSCASAGYLVGVK